MVKRRARQNTLINGVWTLVLTVGWLAGTGPGQVWGQCPVSASFSLPDTICQWSTVTPVNNSIIPGSDTIVYWDWGDGSPIETEWAPSHTFTSTGSYTVQLVVVDTQNNCSDTATQIVVVDSVPHYQLYDGYGNPSDTPVWVFCKNPWDSPSVTVNFQPVISITDSFILYFGDGDSTTGSSWSNLTVISHLYDTIGIYHVTLIVYDSSGCVYTLTGTVYNLLYPTATIIGPPAGSNKGCIPLTVCFVNNSSYADSTTIFIWDYGDGQVDTFDITNIGDTVCHTYTDDYCNGQVKLTAQNMCGYTFTTWGPIDAMGPDSAAIGVDDSIKCWPDTTFTFTNLSQSVACDTATRLFFWDFGNGVTVGWTSSTAPITISYSAPDTYRVMLIDSNTCGTDTAYLRIVLDTPPRVSFIPIPDSVCLGQPITFVNTSDSDAVVFQWNLGDGTQFTTSSTAPFTHVYNWQGMFIVQLRGRDIAGCWSDWYRDTVWVLPWPNAAFNFWPNPAGCPPATITLNNFSWNASEFYWDYGDGHTDTTYNTGTHTHTYDSGGVYTITLIASNGVCTDTAQVTVTVYPEPEAYIVAPDSYCVNVAVPISDSSKIDSGYSIVSWWWDFGDGHTSNSPPPLSHTYTSPGTYVITLVVNSNTNCPDTAYDTITIIPDPVPQFTAVPQWGCDSLVVTITDSSVGGVIWHWDFGNGDTASGPNPPPVLYDTVGTYVITLTVYGPGGCSAQAKDTIQVDPSPIISFNAPDSLCQGESFTLNASIVSPSGSAVSVSWDMGNGDTLTGNPVSYSYTVPDTYVVTLIVVNAEGCVSTAQDTIIVHPGPVAHFTVDTSRGCDSLVVTFTDSSQFAISWTWIFGNGDTAYVQNPPPVLYDTPGIYPVTLIIQGTGGCKGFAYDTIEVYGTEQAGFFATDTLCLNDTLTITNVSSGGTPPVTYTWIFSSGDTFYGLTPPPYTFDSAGTYTITLITTAGAGGFCRDSIVDTVVVHPIPNAYFVSVPASGCELLTVTFVDSSTGGINYHWDFNNGNTDTTSTPPAQTYSAGTYVVTLTLVNGFNCTDVYRDTLQVYPLPIAGMVFQDSVCAYQSVTFTSTSTVPAPSTIIDWKWYFGNGDSATGNPVNYTYTVPDTYTVTLVVTTDAGCKDTIQDTIYVFPSALADFAVVPKSNCGPFTATFTDSSQGATIYQWNFGNGNTWSGPNPPPQNYSSPGMYIATLTVSNPGGCSSTKAETLYVHAIPQAAMLFDDSVCVYDTVSFTDASTIAWETITGWWWDFGTGDTAIVQHPSYVYTSPGVYTVTLIVTSSAGCKDTIQDSIEVFPSVLADFAVVPKSNCGPFTATFTDSSQGATIYQWNFGNGNTWSGPNPPPQNYSSPGMYIATLTVSNPGGCSSTKAETLYVHAIPQAAMLFDDSVCVYDTVSFTDASTIAWETITGWWWDFGTGDTAIIQHPSYVYTSPGVYTVTLIVTSSAGCKDTIQDSIEVFPGPVAQFSLVPSMGCDSVLVTILDSSTGAMTWQWDFGNGNTFTGTPPPPQWYTDTGYYVVTLTVVSPGGCAHTARDTVWVYPRPVADFLIPDSLCQQDTLTLVNTTSFPGGVGSLSWFWDFGDGDTALQYQPVHVYDTSGVFTITLIVSSPQGCVDTVSKPVIIRPLPQAYFTFAPPTGCDSLTVTFTDSSSVGSPSWLISWSWDFGNGNTWSGNNPPSQTYINHTTNDTFFEVTLIVVSSGGCVDTFKDTVHVYGLPDVAFTMSQQAGCGPLTVQFTNQTIPANSSYQWQITGMPTQTDTHITVTFPVAYTDPDTYTVTLVATTPSGCTNQVDTYVVVYPEPAVDFTLLPDSGCHPLTVCFQNQSTGASQYTWLLPDTTLPDPSPCYTFTNTGGIDSTYVIGLTAVSPFGCQGDTVYSSVVVYPFPVAGVQQPDTLYWPDNTVTIPNLSSQGPAFTCIWIWGDGTIDTLPCDQAGTHTYGQWGVYEGTLIVVTPECQDTVGFTVVIMPPLPLPALTFTPTRGCEPLTVYFENQSMYIDSAWLDFGDGSGSEFMTPVSHTYWAGTYTVTLYVWNLTTDSVLVLEDTIVVYPQPEVRFTCLPDTVYVPDMVVTCTEQSSGNPVYFYWEWGDGTTDTGRVVRHIYAEGGEYFITLIGTTIYGCSDTFTAPIIAIESGDLYAPNAFTPDGDGINDYFYIVSTGVEYAELMIFDRWGQLVYREKGQAPRWDGTNMVTGEPCLQDVYVWRYRGKFVTGKEFDISGYVLLIR